MIYLSRFKICSDVQEAGLKIGGMSVYDLFTEDEYYPAKILSSKRLSTVDFEDITVFYGGNGSGKTTLLNIIAEKLNLFRYTSYLQTFVFSEYIKYCQYKTEGKISLNSKFLASDDIFTHILSVREDNKGINQLKREKLDYSSQAKYKPETIYPHGAQVDFDDPDDVNRFMEYAEARRKSRKQFVRSRAGTMQRQYSNGENALMFFDKQIEENALYLLDEPENSLSPRFQLELKTLIEDSVRFHKCQFIIATHSPFMLSLRNAKIYNLDETPVTVEKWHELENIKLMYDLFQENKEFFES
ncbi:MAG: AAA family ATPase [Planctomycetaceae bacterium]|nr:AAA family ATPase [Planctomycetaceae bacterium]